MDAVDPRRRSVSRIWQGHVPTPAAEAFMERLQRELLPEYRRTPTNLGALALQRDEGGGATLISIITFCLAGEAAPDARPVTEEEVLGVPGVVSHHQVAGAPGASWSGCHLV